MDNEIFRKAQDASKRAADAANAIRAAQEAQRVAQEAQRAAEAELKDAIAASEWTKPLELIIPNKDPDKVTVAQIDDFATHPDGSPLSPYMSDDLLSHDDLIAALTDPVVGPKNFENIWGNALSYKALATGTDPQPHIRAMAENRSPSGLAITTLWVRYLDAIVPVHFMLNNKYKSGLIVGEMASLTLCDVFKKAGLRYFNRHANTGGAGILIALEGLTRGFGVVPKYAWENLNEAFELRNVKDYSKSFGWRLAQRSFRATCPKYVLKSKPAKPSV